MSGFSGSGQREIGKSRKLSAFSTGDKLLHEYDFGTTTDTLITVMGPIKSARQKKAVRLLARNVPRTFPCKGCGAPATHICTECMYSSDNPFYCDACGEEHEHEDMLLPVTNSPRMGMCGYDGELDEYAFDPVNLKDGGAQA